MINRPTVFILGAGTSKPYNYPIGYELKNQICTRFESELWELIKNEFHLSREEMKMDARILVEKFSNSPIENIDKFLSIKSNLKLIGKIAISMFILKAEKNAFISGKNTKREEDWFQWLFQNMLSKTNDYRNIIENNISFITFNYDRHIEHSFYHALQSTFGDINKTECRSIIFSLNINHVYGKIYDLEWEQLDNREGLSYKTYFNYNDIKKAAENILIIGEENDELRLQNVKNKIEESERIFLLGFGYNDDNLNIINLPNLLSDKEVYGTTVGFSEAKRLQLQEKFQVLSNGKIKEIVLKKVNCRQLLDEYLTD